MSSLMRLVTLYAISLIGLGRMDQPLFPRWVLELSYLDGGNAAYLSMVLSHHWHNNPIVVTFASLLVKSMEKLHGMTPAEKEAYFRRRRIVNKIYVALMTNKHPKALLGERFYGLTDEQKQEIAEKESKIEINAVEKELKELKDPNAIKVCKVQLATLKKTLKEYQSKCQEEADNKIKNKGEKKKTPQLVFLRKGTAPPTAGLTRSLSKKQSLNAGERSPGKKQSVNAGGLPGLSEALARSEGKIPSEKMNKIDLGENY